MSAETTRKRPSGYSSTGFSLSRGQHFGKEHRYVIWPLAFAAFVPTSRPALLAALLSATVLTLYASIGYDKTGSTEWIFTYRSLPAFALPLLLFLVVCLIGAWTGRQERS